MSGFGKLFLELIVNAASVDGRYLKTIWKNKEFSNVRWVAILITVYKIGKLFYLNFLRNKDFRYLIVYFVSTI